MKPGIKAGAAKTLLLLRHAKSSWDDPAIADFDRPLATRGERDAPEMGRALALRGPLPQVIVSSPAVRTRETLGLFLEAAGLKTRPKFEASLYGASVTDLLQAVRKLPAAKACALMVGHNPGLEELVAGLTGVRAEMPTAALACLELKCADWEETGPGAGELRWLLKPKEL